MKDLYERTELEIIEFMTDDVIITSGSEASGSEEDELEIIT